MLLGAIWIVGGLVGLLVLAGVILWAIGRGIPEEHTATSAINLSGEAPAIFRLIEDIAAYPKWAPGVTAIEPLPAKSGLETCRMRMGRNSFVLMRTLHQPPHHLERTITDDHKAFSGTWTYTVEAKDDGRCQVRLRETGRVTNRVARAMMKHIFGYHMYTNKHLAGLAKALNQDATPHRA